MSKSLEEKKTYEIWAEGYAATGQSSGAIRLAMGRGASFEEAVKAYMEMNESDNYYFDEKHMTYWGCRLFDNEADARATFG